MRCSFKGENTLTPNLLLQLLACAEQHGRLSEPDHEVGDLQEIIFSCWKRLSPELQRQVYDENKHLIRDWLHVEAGTDPQRE